MEAKTLLSIEQNATLEKISWDNIILGVRKTTKEFLENVLGNIIESIVITDLNGTLVFFNDLSEELFHYRAHEVIGKHIVVLGIRKPNVLKEIRAGRNFKGELTLRTKEGTLFPASVTCIPLTDRKNQPIAMVGVARDLTKEKEKEKSDKEIKKLKEFNENIVASLNDGIQLTNSQGYITFVNKRFLDLFRYADQEVLGHPFTEFIAKEMVEKTEEKITQHCMRKEHGTVQTIYVTKGGTRINALLSCAPLFEEDQYTGMICVITDITEIQQLKHELFQSEKLSLLGTLAGEIAHELNNPLGGQILALQTLIDDLESGSSITNEELLQEMRGIEADAQRSARIVAKLLDFSRSFPEDFRPLNINDVIEESLFLIQRKAELDNIACHKRYQTTMPSVLGNPNSLEQVFINLINNARDSMPQGGSIDITTETDGPMVKISISDTGPGIPPDQMKKIFEPFFTTKGPGKGTGLGLAVSKRIIEEHNGQICVSSNLRENGASFVIRLPALMA